MWEACIGIVTFVVGFAIGRWRNRRVRFNLAVQRLSERFKKCEHEWYLDTSGDGYWCVKCRLRMDAKGRTY